MYWIFLKFYSTGSTLSQSFFVDEAIGLSRKKTWKQFLRLPAFNLFGCPRRNGFSLFIVIDFCFLLANRRIDAFRQGNKGRLFGDFNVSNFKTAELYVTFVKNIKILNYYYYNYFLLLCKTDATS